MLSSSFSSSPILKTPNKIKPPSPAPHRTRFRSLFISNTAATTSYNRSSNLYMASNTTSFYEVLGIPIGANIQEIKTAYRRLARTYHPDVVVSVDRKDTSAYEFMKIHAAYSTLSDPEKRAVYDRKLLFKRRRPLTAAGFSGYSGRNWETDQCW